MAQPCHSLQSDPATFARPPTPTQQIPSSQGLRGPLSYFVPCRWQGGSANVLRRSVTSRLSPEHRNKAAFGERLCRCWAYFGGVLWIPLGRWAKGGLQIKCAGLSPCRSTPIPQIPDATKASKGRGQLLGTDSRDARPPQPRSPVTPTSPRFWGLGG